MTIENLRTPLGRLVGGNPAVQQKVTDFYTKKPKVDATGAEIAEWRCEVAFPKKEFLEQIWPYINQEVSVNYPQYANMHPDQYENSKFSWKVINGDSPACPKGSNVPYNSREGYPGNYIIKIRTSAFAPSIFKFENGAYRKIDANEIKTGDYVAVNLNINCHKENDGGLYWNPNGFELVAYGKEIKGSAGGGNPEEMFGRQTYNLPQGASTMPVAPTAAPIPSAAPQAAPIPTAPVAQAAPQAMPAPAYDFVNNAGMPQAAPMPTAPVAQAAPQAMPMGFTGVAPVANPQPSAPQTAAGIAPTATTLISR